MQASPRAPDSAAALGARQAARLRNRSHQVDDGSASAKTSVPVCTVVGAGSQVVPTLQEDDGGTRPTSSRGREGPYPSSLRGVPTRRDGAVTVPTAAGAVEPTCVQADASYQRLGPCDVPPVQLELDVVKGPCSGPVSTRSAFTVPASPLRLTVRTVVSDRPKLGAFSGRPSAEPDARASLRRHGSTRPSRARTVHCSVPTLKVAWVAIGTQGRG